MKHLAPRLGANFEYLVGAIEPLGVTCERLISHVTYFYSSGGQMRVGKAALSRNQSYVDLMVLWSATTAEPLRTMIRTPRKRGSPLT